MVENGDLNWIINGQFIAFAGPQDRAEVSREGYVTLTPDSFVQYFKKKNVGLVVRLNKRCYDERSFTRNGVGHADHYYLDGSVPSRTILSQVMASFERCIFELPYLRRTFKAVAVHCKAGLGRTGTCIGAYMMKHYKFTASEAIGWMRLCRPGCVIGPQQHYLQDIEQQMWYEGDIMRLKVQRSLEASKKKSTTAYADAEEEKCAALGAKQRRRSNRLKMSASGCRKSNAVVSAFHSVVGLGSSEHNANDEVVMSEEQGEALRAAHSKRSHGIS